MLEYEIKIIQLIYKADQVDKQNEGGDFVNSYNLEGIQEILNKVHPKQIINKVGNLKFSLFEVKYQYTTNRNNKREGTKYFFIDTFNPQDDLEKELNEKHKN